MAAGAEAATLSTVTWTTASTFIAVIRSISDAGWLLTAAGQDLTPLAREVGAFVIGTGRAADRDTALRLGVSAFLDLQADKLEDASEDPRSGIGASRPLLHG